MKTRVRIVLCAVVLAAATLNALGQPERQARSPREVAVTFDDLPWVSVVNGGIEPARRMTERLLAALRRHQVPAIGFVNEGKLQPDGVVDPQRVALLEAWLDAGQELGNHTFSHIDLHAARVEDVKADVIRGEVTTRRLLAARGLELRYFRHPFLHRGRDAETRISLEEFLQDRFYRVAPVTIDHSDYVFAAALDRTAARGDEAGVRRIVQAYLGYMESVVDYYERQARSFFQRDIRHVLLLHANTLNAQTFDSLAEMFRKRGYSFVPLDRALADPAYGSAEGYFGPGGISWIHRWALTVGERGAFLAGEPTVPDWIARAAEPLSNQK